MLKRPVWISGLFPLIVTVLFFPLLAFSDSKVHITILHLNDVYEISPVSGGTQGGLARVATLEKQLREENPNTIAVLAGDLISPSALGTASIKGESLAGRQMVNVMNEVGLDYSTFGNHEFDHDAKTLSQRLQESNFSWISSNVSFNTEDQGKQTCVDIWSVSLDRHCLIFSATRLF